MAFLLVLAVPLVPHSLAVLKMAVHIPSVGPEALVLEGAELILHSNNCICSVLSGGFQRVVAFISSTRELKWKMFQILRKHCEGVEQIRASWGQDYRGGIHRLLVQWPEHWEPGRKSWGKFLLEIKPLRHNTEELRKPRAYPGQDACSKKSWEHTKLPFLAGLCAHLKQEMKAEAECKQPDQDLMVCPSTELNCKGWENCFVFTFSLLLPLLTLALKEITVKTPAEHKNSDLRDHTWQRIQTL